jgi:hypothetical protein
MYTLAAIFDRERMHRQGPSGRIFDGETGSQRGATEVLRMAIILTTSTVMAVNANAMHKIRYDSKQ